jgi:hypothetical protein
VVVSLEPERVLVATGSEADRRYPGALPATAVLEGAELPTGLIVVIDEEGHREGAGVAEALARNSHPVTLVGAGVAPASQLADSLAAKTTLRRLRDSGVRLLADARVLVVERGTSRCSSANASKNSTRSR